MRKVNPRPFSGFTFSGGILCREKSMLQHRARLRFTIPGLPRDATKRSGRINQGKTMQDLINGFAKTARN